MIYNEVKGARVLAICIKWNYDHTCHDGEVANPSYEGRE